MNLPNPTGPLSSKLPASTIADANTEVMRVRYTIENGNCQAAQKFSTKYKVIDESSVRGWVTTYKGEVERKQKAGEVSISIVTSPPPHCQVCPPEVVVVHVLLQVAKIR